MTFRTYTTPWDTTSARSCSSLMARRRDKQKGRREGGTFAAFPHDCSSHQNYLELSAPAVKLLHDMHGRVVHHRSGKSNNGDIFAGWSLMKTRGWKSPATLQAARDELEEKGWIVRTTYAARNRPTLYALTWLAIDECGGKLDAPAQPPPGFWKIGHNHRPELWPQKTEILIQKPYLADTDSVSQALKKAA
jgi:hypothetical protein